MKVTDKTIKVKVDVLEKACLHRDCYWPRKNPGVFTQGRGYTHTSDDWLCGTREINGCPKKYIAQR